LGLDVIEALLFLAAEMLLIALLSARPLGARIGLGLAVLALAIPPFVSAPVFTHVLISFGFAWAALRAWDMAYLPEGMGFLQRLVHLLVLVDTRHLWRVQRHFDAGAALKLVLAVALFFAGLYVVRVAEGFTGWPHYALRWSAGAFLAFLGLEAMVAIVTSLLALSGWSTHLLHDAPHRSLTLAEFWGERWNRIVSRLLEGLVFRPLKRRSPWLALTASFVLSGALHAYMIGVPLGATAGLCWGAFFLAQPPLIALERWLKVRCWAPVAGWGWTAGWLLILSPLMTEPALRLFI
jgi:hypothetical protein